jgi:hypothetical protein
MFAIHLFRRSYGFRSVYSAPELLNYVYISKVSCMFSHYYCTNVGEL